MCERDRKECFCVYCQLLSNELLFLSYSQSIVGVPLTSFFSFFDLYDLLRLWSKRETSLITNLFPMFL